MFVKIKFHGILKKHCPKVYEIDASTPAEAIRGLTNQLPQLYKKDGTRYVCRVKECPTKERIFSNLEDITELNIFPSFVAAGGGGKKAGWTQIAIGAVIVGLTITAVVLSGGTLGPIAGSFLSLGIGMMLSGVSTLLTPVPKASSTGDVPQSRMFNHQNTTTSGTRIALCYGKHKMYGHLLSLNLQSSDRNG